MSGFALSLLNYISIRPDIELSASNNLFVYCTIYGFINQETIEMRLNDFCAEYDCILLLIQVFE